MPVEQRTLDDDARRAPPLEGVRVVEAASFVAAPSAGMALSQLGADVIRVDPPGGGSDAGRWPLSRTGASLFWANLNKGKRSVTIDHRTPEGRELLHGPRGRVRGRWRDLPRQHGRRKRD